MACTPVKTPTISGIPPATVAVQTASKPTPPPVVQNDDPEGKSQAGPTSGPYVPILSPLIHPNLFDPPPYSPPVPNAPPMSNLQKVVGDIPSGSDQEVAGIRGGGNFKMVGNVSLTPLRSTSTPNTREKRALNIELECRTLEEKHRLEREQINVTLRELQLTSESEASNSDSGGVQNSLEQLKKARIVPHQQNYYLLYSNKTKRRDRRKYDLTMSKDNIQRGEKKKIGEVT